MSPQLSAGWLEATKLVTAKVAPPRPVASISMASSAIIGLAASRDSLARKCWK